MKNAKIFQLEIHPRIPRRLIRLLELAGNLWYSWDRPTRTLFARLHPGLWDACGHSPKAFLKRVDEQRLVEAAEDHVFLASFNRVMSSYDTYHNEPMRRDFPQHLKQSDLVAYFCAEFGLHESFPIYSGGLGILAGDHCKAASDMRLPFIGVGLLYRQGYFSQTIDADGNQIATNHDSDFDDMPVAPAVDDNNAEVHVHVELPGRTVAVKVWTARVGHVQLILLDTDLPANSPEDRNIAHQLYGGDKHTRIRQEIILGIGGARALAALGLKPSVWHINEGHAAFMVLERVGQLMHERDLDFRSALEACAANTVFTTHTPVPAGHDHFPPDMMREYFGVSCSRCGIGVEEMMALGRTGGSGDFNMTLLALHGSRQHNGVSRIHGDVSARICADMWPRIAAEENPMRYVTNGVHVPTFLATEWQDLFDNKLGYEWRHKQRDAEFWESRIDTIPDHQFWNVRQSLKAQMLHTLRYRMSVQHVRNHGSEAHLDRMLKLANAFNPNVLTIGFARRFATYKRATLMFENMDWLRRIVSEEGRPVLFIFAGKAHPADVPGQALIRRVHEISHQPEFEGRLLMVEGYDLGLARRLVSGVDVWLNNPIYPLEASGTSGMKAGINGALNLSVLDGWWGEGYDGSNGWAIKPSPEHYDEARRNREESQTLYELLQDQIIPLYYQRNETGQPTAWIHMAKRSIATLLPRFNASRMVGEYLEHFYTPASEQGRKLADAEYAGARALSAWKSRVAAAWSKVGLRRVDTPAQRMAFGESLRVEVAVQLDSLPSSDVKVELLISRPTKAGGVKEAQRYELEHGRALGSGEHLFTLEIAPELCGKLSYSVRVYPYHELLTHPYETGLMTWLA
jgi:starch phosphorylase